MPREIKVKVTTDSSSLKAGMKQAEEATNKLHGALDRFGPLGSKAADVLGKMGFASVGAAGAVAGVAAAVAVGVKVAEDAIRQYITLGDAIRRYSQVTGESAETSTRQVFALQELGINVDVASAGMFKLGKAIETSAPKLEKLGIVIAHNSDGTVDLNATLTNLMELYQGTGDAAKRTEIIFAAFGKAGAAMIPILETNVAEMQRLEAQVQMVYTQKDLDAIRQYQIAEKELKQSNDDLGLSIGRALLPAQTAVVQSMNENIYVYEHLDEQMKKMGVTAQSQSRITMELATNALRKEYEASLSARTAIDNLAASQQVAAQAAQQEADAENMLYDALNKSTDAAFAHRQTLIDLKDAQKNYNAAGGHTQENLLRLQEAYYKVGVAAVAKAEAEAEANGTSLDASEKAQIQIQAYRDLEKGLNKNSSLYKALQAYIAELNRIPKDITTIVGVSPAATARARDKNTGGGAIGGYAEGGMVPGPTGTAQLAVVHGGEEVIPVGGNGPGRAGITVIIQGGIFMDHGPTIDALANKVAQRLATVSGF